ncbi:glucose-6-phosphate isomerase [Nakamurella sp. DB0629]|uniref:Glucose-6-phosphate isomerase n=1 Tax=Nakamurella aerolata TaxID=1656892 RepID=A0A849A4L9_9ACTN|nr:glucose-6-phosphate isomerase [Nakamurella aerolata]
MTVSTTVPDRDALAAEVQQLVDDKVASKLTAQDPTLWGPDAESEASIRLSWVGLAESSRPLVNEIVELRGLLAKDGLTHVVLAGMGGSSLAPEVICATAGKPLVTLDTTDPGQIRAALGDQLDRTVLVVSSKSGGTVETDSHRRAYAKAFRDEGLDPAKHIVVVTDPGSPLAKLAETEGYRKVFLADPNVGGRYSALTAFGLVPAGLAGVDIGALLDEAAAAAPGLAADDAGNPALVLGALLGLAQRAGAEKVVIADTGSGIKGFGDWAEQLIAESTGKQGTGILPVVVESPKAPGFADAGKDAVLASIGTDAGVVPASGFAFAISGPLGAQMLTWEYVIAVAGRELGINPFDQPDVESAKAATRKLLADTNNDGGDSSKGSGNSDGDDEQSKPGAAATVELDGITVSGSPEIVDGATDLATLLDNVVKAAPAAGYLAIQAYLDRLTDDAAPLRPLLAAKSGLQTTFGWGPRFLHSTGQYHKGGHPNGVFVQITGDSAEDLPIPEQPFTFGELQQAQARGDGSVLAEHGRPVVTLHLKDRTAGLDALARALS